MNRLVRPATALRVLALCAPTLLGLAGCIGAPAPGPVAYAPGQQVPYGAQCFAGVYTCNLPQALPVGSQCACPGLGAPSYGAVR